MVNSRVLEPSKSEPSWRMCTVEMVHKKYLQTLFYVCKERDQSYLEFERVYRL